MIPAVFNWSGGKDSAMALWTVLQEGRFEVRYLLTTLNREYARVSMHGVRETLLDQQAASLGIPLKKVWLPPDTTMESYDATLHETLHELSGEGIHTSIFGDIFLEDLRNYREKALAKVGWQADFPLWNRKTKALANEVIKSGFKAVLVCVDGKRLEAEFAGRMYDGALLKDLPEGVDPCGENGEFHTFVFDGPPLKTPVTFEKGEVVERAGFYFCDLKSVPSAHALEL
jgi:uncharacterized protein (TIGR00290 family)